MSSVSAWGALDEQAQAARSCGDHEAALAAFEAVAGLLPEAGWVQVQIGTEHQALGNENSAVRAFELALRLEPQNIFARNGLAKLARARGEREAALALFRDIMAIAPETLWAATEAAAELVALGRRNEAEQLYKELLVRAPDHVFALLGLGKLRREAGRLAAALELFLAASRAASENPWPYLECGDVLLAQGKAAEAEQAYIRFAELGGEAHLATLGQGRCARARGDAAGALAHFTHACSLAPSSLWPWLARATEERDQSEFEAARASARTALTQHPTDPLPWRNLAETEFRAGQLDAAADVLRSALSHSAADAGLLADLARIEGQRGHLVNADDLLAKALDLDPCNVAALALLMEHDQQRGDTTESMTRYQQALEHRPESLPLRIGALKAHGLGGELSEALVGFADMATEGTSTPEFYLAWGQLAREAGDAAFALHLMREATACFPGNFWLVIERMQAALQVGPQDAELTFLRGATVKGRSEQTYRHLFLGRFAERAGQLDTAIRHYAAATRVNPQEITPHVELARTKILRLDLDGAKYHLARIAEINPGAILRRGSSLNISQSHLGQILDEYAIDRDVLSQLQAMSGFQPAHRAEALRVLAAAYPDNVAVAITLMVALREAGRFDHIKPRENLLKIPNVIVQFWDAEEPPEDVAGLMASWRARNPDYEVRCFSLGTAASFLKQSYSEPVLRAFLRPTEPAKRADLFRLAWLYNAGGVYADADDLCLAPLATVLPTGADMVLYQEEYGTVGNNFIATAPGNPVIKYALNQAVIAINRGDTDILWLSTGPGLLTRALAQQFCTQSPASVPAGLAVLQRHELNQAVAPHCKVNYKKTSLHWTKSSFNARRPRHKGAGPQNTTYTLSASGHSSDSRNSFVIEELSPIQSPDAPPP